MPLNEQQQRIVDALDASVNVVAGAGTGKTFTLTERIVAAIDASIQKRPDDPAPYDHVMAITFTKKAAAELRSRVRSAFLRKAAEGGLNADAYAKCARSIDSAWISTIHSMAGRILRECAIETGIDPDFVTLTAQESDSIFARAIDLALEDARSDPDPDLRALLETKQVAEESSNSGAVSTFVDMLLGCVSYMPSGLGGVSLRDPGREVHDALSSFFRKACDVKEAFKDDGWPAGEARKIEEHLPQLEEAISRYEEWSVGGDAGCSSPEEALAQAEGVLFSFPPTTNMFGKKSDHFETMLEYRLEYKKAASSLAAHPASRKTKALVRFAGMVKRRMDEIKSSGATKFSESDLLEKCNEMLGDPANSRILERYREQFDYIMLDEFQDTDKLQMDIVGKLCVQEGPDSSFMSNVCTVGDMQQSIYRFRGGDVEETQKRTAAMKSGGGLQFELSNNYRSHKDILDAVEKVFSPQDVFGEGFLRLNAECPSLDERCAELFDGKPRVIFDFVHGSKASRGSDDSVSTADARKVAAHAIAKRFKSLADSGVSPSRMAVLLGKMTHAAAYSEALSAVGLECAITGGSVFADSSEAVFVENLLKHAVCPDDDLPLLEVLKSGAFSVSDDMLLLLVRPIDEAGVSRRRLSHAFYSNEVPQGLSEEDEKTLGHARKMLADFRDNARRHGAEFALRRLFVDSGLLGALSASSSAESLVSAGNLEKAARIVADIEGGSTGVAQTSFEYSWHIATAKEAPGSLSTGSSEFVQVMTIHASKGLEFDHVAVAELREGASSYSGSLSLENIDDCTYVAFRPEKSDFADSACYDRYKYVQAFTFEGLEEGSEALDGCDSKYERTLMMKQRAHGSRSYEEIFERMTEYTAAQELDEARRLMYVAMTRARESLLVSYVTTVKPESGYKGTVADVFEALKLHFGDSSLLEENEFDVTQMPIRARRTHLLSADDVEKELVDVATPESGDEPPSLEENSIKAPVYERHALPNVAPGNFSREGIYSYSSLSGFMEHDDAPLEEGAQPEAANVVFSDESTQDPGVDISGSATDLGTAFHRIAQAAIEERQGKGPISRPEGSLVNAQARTNRLTDGQKKRLERALETWFGSDAAESFSTHDECLAEVPFSLEVPSGTCSFVLEGEIDGLAYDHGSEVAFLVDYKTGDSHGASDDKLHEKHLLQSQCYAYALLAAGFKRVEASFVRVEEKSFDDPSQPRIVRYSYHSDEFFTLGDEIAAAYRYSVPKDAEGSEAS